MINFEKFTLNNGLRVIVHQDASTPIVAMNILYDVGARDETPGKTGFAHLFEHLMFGGSVNIPKYDVPLQKAGGENNAFTSNDVTNYYLTLPKQNLETAFWLESDRMYKLAFSEKSLEVQRNVVSEEFRQTHLNQPYGDVWLLMRPLAYKVHPYKWPTIGEKIEHITNAKMEDVKAFYGKYYNPNNAILVVSGDVEVDEIKKLAEKWFGPTENNGNNKREIPVEPVQKEARFMEVERDVPLDAVYKCWHMCSRTDEAYHATDLLSDMLGNGNSSRLYYELVKNKNLFSEINAFVMGSMDKGLFVVSGNLLKGIKPEDAEAAINNEIDKIRTSMIDEKELQKVKNKVESTLVFSEMNVLDKAMNLAFAELAGDAENVNLEAGKYQAVTPEKILDTAANVFRPENCSTLFYRAK
ncbi:MAG: peptidase M16 [Bacteroidetes bacterium 4484_276]|nr:MAG: peptidase M16 [Bacteroidetes bacterium 4484_276]OYT14065.1 MAG: peptidase M16 [Bacteroidetes bacterium 4572_114]